MPIDLQATFEKFDDDFLKFEAVETKFSARPDLHAFILLDKLVPGNKDIINCSEHDEFFISIDPEKLAEVATEENIRDLHRCGVRWSDDVESLCMFA